MGSDKFKFRVKNNPHKKQSYIANKASRKPEEDMSVEEALAAAEEEAAEETKEFNEMLKEVEDGE